MIKRISKTQIIKDQLKKDGKSILLDKPHHMQAVVTMNEQLEVVKREFQLKDRNSQVKAAGIVLNS